MKNTDNRVSGVDFSNSTTKDDIKMMTNIIERYRQRVFKKPLLKAFSLILIGWVAGSNMIAINHELTTIITVLAILIQSLIVMVPSLILYLLRFYILLTQHIIYLEGSFCFYSGNIAYFGKKRK